MADDYEDYIFEHKRKTSSEFVLANGDVTTVLKGLKNGRTMTVKRAASKWDIAPVYSVRMGNTALPVVHARSGTVFRFSVSPRIPFSSALIIHSGAGLSAPTEGFSVQSAGNNTSNGEDLTLKEQATPVFSGLFANHEENNTGTDPKADSIVGKGAGGLPFSVDISATETPAAFSDPASGVLSNVSGGNDSSSIGGAAARSGVKRRLTLNAGDMANCKSYQIGYDDPDSAPVVNSGTAGDSSATVEYSSGQPRDWLPDTARSAK